MNVLKNAKKVNPSYLTYAVYEDINIAFVGWVTTCIGAEEMKKDTRYLRVPWKD